MRVIPTRPARPRIAGDERGAIAALVAVCSTVIFGCAALALDLGNTWQAQRRLHTATDAAALASAQAYAEDQDGCSSLAGSYVADNDSHATMTSCTTGTGTGGTAGYVTVRAKRTVDFNFAGVLSFSSEDVVSSTTAGWGSPKAAGGLRPLAVCQYFPALAAWLNAPAGPIGPSDPITIPYSKSDQGCDNAPGNWGLLDYDDDGGGANDVRDWFINGFPEPVTIPSLIGPQTGHVSSIKSALNGLVQTGERFPIPLFDVVSGTGNNAQYHAVGVAKVQLLAFDVTSTPSSQYFKVRFYPGIVAGSCCGTGPDTGVRAVGICAVNTGPESGECGQ